MQAVHYLVKETSYVLEWGLALDLEGDRVEDLLAELVLLELAQLCEDGEGSLGGLLQEHCVGRERDVEDQEDCDKGLGHLYQIFFLLWENDVFFFFYTKNLLYVLEFEWFSLLSLIVCE